jgi:hypothetical protein
MRAAILGLLLFWTTSATWAQSCHEVRTAPDKGYPEGRGIVDFNGDGCVDFCRIVGDRPNSRARCTMQTATGRREVTSGPVDMGWGNSGWSDINGDGRADYCSVAGPRRGERYGDRIKCLLAGSEGTAFGRVVTSQPGIDVGYLRRHSFEVVPPTFCRVVGNRGATVIRCTELSMVDGRIALGASVDEPDPDRVDVKASCECERYQNRLSLIVKTRDMCGLAMCTMQCRTVHKQYVRAARCTGGSGSCGKGCEGRWVPVVGFG